MAEKKLSTYLLLEFDCEGRSLSEINDALVSKVRTSDVLGLGRNGKIKLLLSQATESDLKFILPRLESSGLTPIITNNKD